MTSNQRLKLFFISELATIFNVLSIVILVTIVLERLVGMELHESYPFQGGYCYLAYNKLVGAWLKDFQTQTQEEVSAIILSALKSAYFVCISFIFH